MSADGQGELEPEVPRKNVVGLFCGAAFHDVVFARVSGCDVVRLYDWELTAQQFSGNRVVAGSAMRHQLMSRNSQRSPGNAYSVYLGLLP